MILGCQPGHETALQGLSWLGEPRALWPSHQLTSHSWNMRVRKVYSLARRDRKSISSSTHSGSFSGSRLQREASARGGNKISVTKAEAAVLISKSNKTSPLA